MPKHSEPTIVIADVESVRYQVIHNEGSKLFNIIGGKLDLVFSFEEWQQINEAVRFLGNRHNDAELKKMWAPKST